ncbi:hypothetical protein QJS83_11440 [Bdellovibrio sp. 22V]|uniref:hypothetical protein n=1 Tax=Bdellovibrio TaxID=958 RepID=UPI002542BA46|nr:hypothetical protein [Bdellovibrio sp. 22V]WII71075.1 hypothetical protein QJS83_11440 [Bdellovibrio sp. 22V]
MSTFVKEFKKYQKQERLLTGSMVLVSVLAPISFTWLMEKRAHWTVSTAVVVFMCATALYLHAIRARVASKLMKKYEDLDVGSVLAKKLAPTDPRKFMVTNRGYNHFYLKCLSTGEQVLVSKHRVQEDFDIAN